jgi:hypothetical protein
MLVTLLILCVHALDWDAYLNRTLRRVRLVKDHFARKIIEAALKIRDPKVFDAE